MPLVNRISVVTGTVLSADFFNEIQNPVFDGQPQYVGHLAKISDSDLSDDPNGLKNRVSVLGNNLEVTAGTGLNANYRAGKVLYGSTVFSFNGSSVALTASANNWIYVTQIGQLVATVTPPPPVRCLLALVVTNTTGVVTVTDLRDGFRTDTVKPAPNTLRNFGGRGEGGAYVAVNGDNLIDGEYYFTDFTVPAGVTISVDKLARVYCTGTATIAGTINVTNTGNGAKPIISGGGNLRVSGGAGSGLGGGLGEDPPATYNYLASPLGSGGGGGGVSRDATTAFTIGSSTGGGGGGSFWLEAAGNISVTGTINANGIAGQAGTISATATAGSTWAIGGGGGGSGGLILLRSLTSIVYSGTASAVGGAGGAGVNGDTTRTSEAGSGGGGGIIALFAPSINTTGWTSSVAGGAAGAGTITSGSAVIGIGGVGASFGGAGGGQTLPNGFAGNTGRIITRTYTPIG